MRWLVFVLVLSSLAVACDKGDKPDAGDGMAEDGADKSGANAASQTLVAKTEAGEDVVSITLAGDKVEISYGGSTQLVGKNKSGKRKYDKGGEVVVVVKSDTDKFKLKDEAGKLLWKVKLKDDKVKISDTEEGDGDNTFSIKTKDDGFKVKRGEDKELGKVKFYPDDKRIKVKDAAGSEQFKASADKASAAWGVLLLSDIPEDLRFVIMAELASRGR
jgi:hypothetical protein